MAWAPAAWTTIGTAGAAQRTPDLSTLVAEVTGRTGWASGNAIVFLLTGTGKRTAEAFEGDRTRAPSLHVEYAPSGSILSAMPVALDAPAPKSTLPARLAVFVVPSPLEHAGTLHLDLPRGGRVTIQLFDVGGRVVRDMVDLPYLAPGRHSFPLNPRGSDGHRLAAGVYFYRVKTPSEHAQGQVVVLE